MLRIPPDVLRTLIAISETGSFTSAAIRLNSTQSTVSHQIRRLEDSLGRKLIRRTTRTVMLNSDGEILKSHALRIIDAYERMEWHFDDAKIEGIVRFGLAEDYFSDWMSKLLHSFKQSYRNVRLDIGIGPSTNILRDLNAGRIDIALTRHVPPGPDGIHLWEEPLEWVVGREFELEGGAIPLALLNNPCIYRKTVLEVLRESKVPHKIELTCSAHQLLKQAVSANLAISATARGDMVKGWKTLSVNDGLPMLPMVQTTLHYAPGNVNKATQKLGDLIVSEHVEGVRRPYT